MAIASDQGWIGWAGADTLNRVLAGAGPAPEGIGFKLVDAENNLPDSGNYQTTVDFRAGYRAVWGVLAGVTSGGVGASVAVLEATGISKRYPGTRALDGVDLSVGCNDIHGLLGGNGSGKSTLIKILAGVAKADAGHIRVGATAAPAQAWSARAARAGGIRVVHQDPAVFRDMTVADNLAAGHGYATGGRGPHPHPRLGPGAPHGCWSSYGSTPPRPRQSHGCAPPHQTMLAIGRALQDVDAHDSSLLVLDEPTAALPRGEVEYAVFDALRRCAAEGQAILFVSHRLPEVLSLCSRVTVLRDGAKVTTTPTAGLDELDLGEPSSPDGGWPPLSTVRSRRWPTGPRCCTPGDWPTDRCGGWTWSCGRARSWASPACSGRVAPPCCACCSEICDRRAARSPSPDGPLDLRSPRAAIEAGIALVPEDRGRDAVFPSLDLDANLAAGVLREYWRGGLLRARRQREDSRGLVAEFGVKAVDVAQPLTALSGGNQQKMVLARCLRTRPRVLLLDNPTQGVDVAAREDIHRLVRVAAERGTAGLVVSDDFEELARLCDGVLVLRDGCLTAHLTASELTADRIGREVYGGSKQQ